MKVKRCFIISTCPDELLVEKGGSQAANNFCNALIKGSVFDMVYSIVPVHEYDDRIESTSSIEYLTGNVCFPRFIRYFEMIWNNIRCVVKAKSYNHIWFYNLDIGNVICYIILKYIFRKKVYIILLDFTPGYLIFDIQHWLLKLLKRSDGIIFLSGRVEIHHQNAIYKAGCINLPHASHANDRNNCCKKFLICGELDDFTGLPLVLDVFSELPECQLILTGRLANNYQEAISRYPNIRYLGYINFEDYKDLLVKSDVCLSLRNPSYEENNYNFPSKVLEFFAYDKIVISTIDYPELEGFQYIYCQYDKKSVIDVIRKLCKMSVDDLDFYRNNSAKLEEYFSADSWRKSMAQIEHS